MIDDPPLIKLKKNTPRPTDAQIAALTGVPSGFLVDAMDGAGAMSWTVKPVDPSNSSFCGVAVTCHAGPADNLAAVAALPRAGKDSVIVAGTGAFMETAVIGDLVLHMAKNRGAVAFVTDGAVRDTPGIIDVGLPCFAAGVTPNSPARNGPGTVNLPITLAGVTVSAGDIVAGDVDGVVVVPFAEIDRVIVRLKDVQAREDEMMAAVGNGLSVPGYVEDLYAGGKVEEVE